MQQRRLHARAPSARDGTTRAARPAERRAKAASIAAPTASASREPVAPVRSFRTREERLAEGRALRAIVPRDSHASWRWPGRARDPVEILERSSEGRVPELVPIRIARMLASPFAFLRGSADLMAHDLGAMPRTGVRLQSCGDCHLSNFGVYASPERALVFDVNDFDETLPAPWEWDVLRLAASIAVAAREHGLSDAVAREAAATSARAYRERLRELSRMPPLDVWYARVDVDELADHAPSRSARAQRRKLARSARKQSAESVYPEIAAQVAGRARIVDRPPLVRHVDDPDAEARVVEGLAAYRRSLPEERRVLLDRYRLEDFAVKVVGIGSVGTRCYVALLFSEESHPLILQMKEAGRSALEPWAGPSAYDNQGQRVVVGQRLMQSASDIFLGWARGRGGRDFYVRQLRDMKQSVSIEDLGRRELERYASLCGACLARAHAKSGDAATISGYLGKGDAFDLAAGAFALAYADQTERDHEALAKAVRAGRITARDEPH